ncbi:hypothetical protein MHM84_14215 [Halomonas sp. McH1-25]|uniref:hypothetical protein n=1 Tax=unclassified Halomonas TaxID=2609666 RepID=UPI001EF5142B|nr:MULTISPECIES: hypothetical protein [unclassified Halomonas]MCG7600935.1 hypothetical protein [Halomonas sp. McH1-25]MCP1341523.1 hypothetical protein [Halomonas sp. FL8]MCP1359791.1 hypothetical protein [Halomonas sp. BBD45]
MKHRVLPFIVALGLAGSASLALADSPALQRARESADKVDLSKFFTSRTDARSQSFGFGGTHEHPFTVDKAGQYVFTSSTLPGESNDYRINAVILNDQGKAVARGDALGKNGGLRLVEQLEPGDYILRVTANKFGTESAGGNSYNVEVAGLDEQGHRLSSDQSGIDGGTGIRFGGPGRDGRTTAFVNKNDAVAAVAAPQVANESVGADVNDAQSAAGAASTPDASPMQAAETPQQQDMPTAFDEIVADIDIRTRGEVLSFDVVEAGTVSVTSSTFMGSETEYRLEAKILDEQGKVVASDKASGFEGDFAIRTRLQPGRYTVWVSGQKFGSASSGVNNYALRIQQLDTQ